MGTLLPVAETVVRTWVFFWLRDLSRAEERWDACSLLMVLVLRILRDTSMPSNFVTSRLCHLIHYVVVVLVCTRKCNRVGYATLGLGLEISRTRAKAKIHTKILLTSSKYL